MARSTILADELANDCGLRLAMTPYADPQASERKVP
jgi:hypothetical protein